MKLGSAALALPLSLLCACSNHASADPTLGPESVTEIPAGDAAGTGFSAQYDLEIVTVDCSGACGPFEYEGWTVTLCDIGEVVHEHVDVEQDDGSLVVTGDNNLFVSRQRGGIDADGSFEVGGYATELAGKIKMTSLAEGRIEDDGRFDASARARVWGRYDDAAADCYGTFEVTGGYR